MLEIQYRNVAARLIAGVSRAARLDVLHLVAAALSARNMCVQQCALLMDGAVRARGFLTQRAVRAYLAKPSSVRTRRGRNRNLAFAEKIELRRGRRGMREYDLREERLAHTLDVPPVTPDGLRASRIFCTMSEVVCAEPELRRQTFDFKQTD